MYGRDPPSLLRIAQGETPVGSLDELLQERDAILDDLCYNLVRDQQVMKAAADGKWRQESFEVDDWFFLKLQPCRQRSLARRPFDKLASRFYGPYHDVQKIRKVAYRLELPESAKVHPIFHVSQLKCTVHDHSTGSPY